MKRVIKLLINAIAVLVLAEILNGVTIQNYTTAVCVALVLAVLNLFVKPILVILTLPITVFTLGLFLLVVNAFIILLADHLISDFSVSSFWSAIVFSVLLSVLQSVLHSFFKQNKE